MAPAGHVDFELADTEEGLVNLAADHDRHADRELRFAVELDRARAIGEGIGLVLVLASDLADENDVAIIHADVIVLIASDDPSDAADRSFVL